MNTLKENNLFPTLLIPDYLALPLNSNQPTLLIEDNMALLKSSSQKGFSIECSILESLDIKSQQNKLEGPLETLINHAILKNTSPINLLKTKQRRQKNNTSYWEWCARSAIAFVVLLFIGQLSLYVDFKLKNNTVKNQLVASYKNLLPNNTSLDQPKVRITHLLKSYELARNPFLSILKRISHAKEQHPNITIHSISYSSLKETISLSAESRDELIAFNKTLSTAGLIIKSNQIIAKNKKVTENITVGVS